MSDALLITATPYGLRAAEIADGEPVAFFVESAARPSRIGDIHLARPVRQMAAVDATFMDLGDGATAFLPGTPQTTADASCLVRVVADAHREKLPRLTTRLALPGRLLVLHPAATAHSLPRRAPADGPANGPADGPGGAHARTLLAALDARGVHAGAFVLRSAGLTASVEAVRAEAARLEDRWSAIARAAREDGAPRRLTSAGGLLGRLLRDHTLPDRTRIVIDDRATLERAARRAASDAPDIAEVLAPHDGAEPLFERHDCEGRLAGALRPEVALPSGGRLVIEETQALTAVDVDTAAGLRAGRGTAARGTNREAALALAREIRLRNLSGMIVADFPREAGARDRAGIVAGLRRHLAADTTPHRVLGVTAGGLVEINRQRIGESLRDALTEAAPGGGRRPRADAVAFDAAEDAARAARTAVRGLTIQAAPALLETLGDADALARWLGSDVVYAADPARAPERYSIEPR